MLEGFQQLTTEEMDTLVSTPIWITALIGAADGEIDHDERTWSDRLMRARTYSMPALVNEYYRVVAEDFLGKLDRLMEVMSDDVETRSAELAEKIAAANPIRQTGTGVGGYAVQKFRHLGQRDGQSIRRFPAHRGRQRCRIPLDTIAHAHPGRLGGRRPQCGLG